MSSFIRGSLRLAQIGQRSSRAFSTSRAARKDIIQDLYVSELRAYKPPPAAKDAHIGVVKPYSAPSAPSAPVAPTDLASELAAYDAQDPQVAESPVQNLAQEAETGAGAPEFLAFLESDLPKPEAHH